MRPIPKKVVFGDNLVIEESEDEIRIRELFKS